MSQAWTIINGETGELRYACFLTDDIDQHPIDYGWDALPTDEYIPLDFVPKPPHDEWTGEGWVACLDRLKFDKWQTVKQLRNARQDSTAPTPFGLVDCDDVSKIKITGLVSMAMIAGPAFEVGFTMADGSVLEPVDADSMIAIGVAVGQHVNACHVHARQLKAAINAASSVSELNAIDVQAGWP